MPAGTLEAEESSRLFKASRGVGILNAVIYLGQTVEPFPLCLCFSVIKTVTLSKGQWHRPRGIWYRKYKQINRDLEVPLLTLGMSLPMERSNNCHPKICLFGVRSTLLLRDKRLRKNLWLFHNCLKAFSEGADSRKEINYKKLIYTRCDWQGGT